MKKGMTFEKSMERLEEIVRLLENGQVPLDESLKLFEEGTKLAADCTSALEKAETKITVLTERQEEQHEES